MIYIYNKDKWQIGDYWLNILYCTLMCAYWNLAFLTFRTILESWGIHLIIVNLTSFLS
jgi:hypothetical protein